MGYYRRQRHPDHHSHIFYVAGCWAHPSSQVSLCGAARVDLHEETMSMQALPKDTCDQCRALYQDRVR